MTLKNGRQTDAERRKTSRIAADSKGQGEKERGRRPVIRFGARVDAKAYFGGYRKRGRLQIEHT